MGEIRKILFLICLFVLISPFIYSLTITPISPENDSVIKENSVLLSVFTDKYANCSYSLDLNSFNNFDNSTADYWKVGGHIGKSARSKKLELSEDLAVGGINREILSNITTFIHRGDLKVLDSGTVTNNRNTSKYNQYLYLLGSEAQKNMDTGFVIYTQDDQDISADFLYFKAGREIGRYLLEFTTPFESDKYDENGSVSSDGLFLRDFENFNLTILGKVYTIVNATRSPSSVNGINLTIQSFNDKIELSDTNISDIGVGENSIVVNGKVIHNAKSIIEGSITNASMKINRINVNMTVDDNIFVPAGGKLSETIKAVSSSAKPEVIFTQNWDIVYKGLSKEPTETVKIKTSGSSQYVLEFTDGDGNKVSLPFAMAPSGSQLQFGDVNNRALINKENKTINKDDYFVITNGTGVRGSRTTYVLKYIGADKISVNGHVLRFKNLGDGATIQLNYSDSTPLAYINLSGIKSGVYLATNADINQNDFGIQIDLDGDETLDKITNSNLLITTRNGAEINLTNQSGNSIQFSVRIPDDDKNTGKSIYTVENITAIINVTNGSGNTTVNTKEIIKIYTQGNNTYFLEFTDGNGDKVYLPIAENGTNNTIFFGQINKSLINKESEIIKKDYYFVISDDNHDRGKRISYSLQYLGADRVTVNSPVLKFKNLGSGETFQQPYADTSPLATLKLGGQDFRVYNSPSTDVSVDDFDIQIDLDANGSLSSDNGYTIPITTYPKGVEINLTNESLPNTVQLTVRTFDTVINQTLKAKDKVETLSATVMRWNITASSGKVQMAQDTSTEESRINLRTPSGKSNIAYGSDSYGDFYTYETPTNDSAIITIEVPQKQRTPLVYYENAGEHSILLTNLNEGQHNVQINCTDIFDNIFDDYIAFTVNFTDKDNDGIPDSEDMLLGNSSNINTSTINPIIEIDNSTNLSKKFGEIKLVRLKNNNNNNKTLVEFEYNFSKYVLDLSNIGIDIQINSTNGMIIINLKGMSIVGTKTLYVDNLNNITTLCIKDEAITSISQISSLCNNADEFGINCPGTANNGQYKCTFADDTNSTFKIIGLTHSGIHQQTYCGDGVVNNGESCSNCPADVGSCSSPGDGNSGSSGGGSGGGGGGGGLTFVCNMDWKCGEWSECVNGLQTRSCEFVKVPQHAQDTECPLQDKQPTTSQKCEVVKKIEKQEITKPNEVKEEAKPEINESKKELITGMAVEALKEKSNISIAFITISIFVALGVFFYYKFFKLKK